MGKKKSGLEEVKQNWIQLLVGGIILALLFFMLQNQFSMKGVLSKVQNQVETNENRVSRIAETLPEVKARVAWEEVNSALEGFVVVDLPKQHENQWITRATLYSRDNNELKTYQVAMDENAKTHASYIIAGKLKEISPYDISFDELSLYSTSIKHATYFPPSINKNASFVFRANTSASLEKLLLDLSMAEPTVAKIETIKNWDELVKRIETIVVDDSN